MTPEVAAPPQPADEPFREEPLGQQNDDAQVEQVLSGTGIGQVHTVLAEGLYTPQPFYLAGGNGPLLKQQVGGAGVGKMGEGEQEEVKRARQAQQEFHRVLLLLPFGQWVVPDNVVTALYFEFIEHLHRLPHLVVAAGPVVVALVGHLRVLDAHEHCFQPGGFELLYILPVDQGWLDEALERETDLPGVALAELRHPVFVKGKNLVIETHAAHVAEILAGVLDFGQHIVHAPEAEIRFFSRVHLLFQRLVVTKGA